MYLLQLKRQRMLIGVSIATLTLLGWWLVASNHQDNNGITTEVEIGNVKSTVDVSGYATVDATIPLSFPKGGTVSNILVEKGEEVATGTVLALIGSTEAEAEYAMAEAELKRAIALRDEVQNGQTLEQNEVTKATIISAETALINTIKNEAAKVDKARVTLLSSGLTAVSSNGNTQATAPTISGSYTCTGEGEYRIRPYRSGSDSGYAYQYEGIESGTATVYTNQSGPLGKCGLRLQFSENANYTGTNWVITIPNTNSLNYAINKATYDQALINEEQNIASAQSALELALSKADAETAGARVETLIAYNASVASAQSKLQQVASKLTDTAIRAPRFGVITDIDIAIGQTVTAEPVITMFSPTRVTFTARIPEIDIRKIQIGQEAVLSFDANKEDVRNGKVTFVSPTPVTIDGVAYFETTISLEQAPDWLRDGMHADVSIVTQNTTEVTKLPIRFIRNINDKPEILIYNKNKKPTVTTIRVINKGTDGNAAIEGVPAGTKVIAP